MAFGQGEYLSLAVMLFESLHRAGSTAERVCVTDRDHDFPPHLNVRCVVMEHSVSMKAAAPGIFSLKDEDYIMLVDSDMIFCRNPDFLFEGDQVRVATTGVPVVSSQFTFNRAFLEDYEVAKIPRARCCINTGLMVFPGDKAASFAETWATFHLSVRGEEKGGYILLHDQPALEALLIRGVLCAELLPGAFMHFPAGTKNPPSADCVVLHFTGYPRTQSGKSRIAAAMSAALLSL